jgi:hypothetical protein
MVALCCFPFRTANIAWPAIQPNNQQQLPFLASQEYLASPRIYPGTQSEPLQRSQGI